MSTVIISKNSGSGNGSFTVIADRPNTGAETIHKEIIVRRSDGLSRTVTFTQLPNPEATSPWNAYGFYATDSNGSQATWGNYTNPGAPTIGQIYGNWEYNGIKQVDFGTYTNPYRIVFEKGGSYRKNFKVESFDIELNDCSWEVTTVKDSHTDITVSPQSAAASSGCTIRCSQDQAADSEHIYKFKQTESGLEFYIAVTIQSNQDSPIPMAITAISVQNIEAYVNERKLLFNKIDVTPSEMQSDFTSDLIARVEFADPSIARWDGEYITALAEGETTFTVYLTNGVRNTTPATLSVVPYVEPTPSGEGKTFLITYNWTGNADLDTATYIYTGDDDYIVTNATHRETFPNNQGHCDSHGEFYGYRNSPTAMYLSNGEAVPVNCAESPQGNIWFAGNNHDKSSIKCEQVMICMGDAAGGSRYGIINQLNTEHNSNFNEDIFIDMYCNWNSTASTPDHGGKDDGRQFIGKIVSITIDEYENAGFTLDSSTNTFRATSANRLVNTWQWRDPSEAVNGVYQPFTFGAADSISGCDPKQYYASIVRMKYNTQARVPEFTDLRFDYSQSILEPQGNKKPGVIPEFYPQANYPEGEGASVVSRWCGGDISDGPGARTVTSDGGSFREFIIEGIRWDQPWVPVRIYSSLIQPTNGVSFADGFNNSTDLQDFAHWGKGFTIKPLWCNLSAKHVKVYDCASTDDISDSTLIGQVYPDDADFWAYEGLHVDNNSSADSQYVDLVFDFSYCMSGDFEIGEQQAAPWRYVDLVMQQDNSPELIHLTFKFENPNYISDSIDEIKVLWPSKNGDDQYKRNITDISMVPFSYQPTAQASGSDPDAAEYVAFIYKFNDTRPATGQAVQNGHGLFESGIAPNVTLQALDLDVVSIPAWVTISAAQGYRTPEGQNWSTPTAISAGDTITTLENEIRYPIEGNDFTVEFFNRQSNVPFFERQFRDYIYVNFEENTSRFVREGDIVVNFEGGESETEKSLHIWQGGTIKIVPEVTQSFTGAADGVIVYPDGWANGEQIEWRNFLLQGDNTAYETEESKFIAAYIGGRAVSHDTFELLGAGIRPGMGSTDVPEEKRDVTVTFHIYQMNESGEYVEYTAEQYQNVHIQMYSDTDGFDYGNGHGQVVNNTVTGKVDWNTEPDNAYVSVIIDETVSEGGGGQPGEMFVFGKFDVKLKLRANSEPSFG